MPSLRVDSFGDKLVSLSFLELNGMVEVGGSGYHGRRAKSLKKDYHYDAWGDVRS